MNVRDLHDVRLDPSSDPLCPIQTDASIQVTLLTRTAALRASCSTAQEIFS